MELTLPFGSCAIAICRDSINALNLRNLWCVLHCLAVLLDALRRLFLLLLSLVLSVSVALALALASACARA